MVDVNERWGRETERKNVERWMSADAVGILVEGKRDKNKM